MAHSIYFQIQYGSAHSDGCHPMNQKFGDFRKFSHDLLDEFLDALERGDIEVSDELLEGSHIVFGICSIHGQHPARERSDKSAWENQPQWISGAREWSDELDEAVKQQWVDEFLAQYKGAGSESGNG